MQVDAQGAGGTPEDSAGGTDQEVQNGSKAGGKDSVSYDTYKKTLSEAKKLREQLRSMDDLQARLKELEQEKLGSEGKKDEVISSLKAELDKTSKEKKQVFQKFAYRSLGEQVRVEAMKQGCVDATALMKLADLSEVEIDPDTFEADKDRLAEIVTGMKSTNPYLFSKSAPRINANLPNGEQNVDKKAIDFKKMTAAEITEWLNKNR